MRERARARERERERVDGREGPAASDVLLEPLLSSSLMIARIGTCNQQQAPAINNRHLQSSIRSSTTGTWRHASHSNMPLFVMHTCPHTHTHIHTNGISQSLHTGIKFTHAHTDKPVCVPNFNPRSPSQTFPTAIPALRPPPPSPRRSRRLVLSPG